MYRLRLSHAADHDLGRLDPPVRRRILERLAWFVAHIDEIEHEALKGPLADSLKLRVGDYRVFYQINREANIVIIERVKHRSEAYR